MCGRTYDQLSTIIEILSGTSIAPEIVSPTRRMGKLTAVMGAMGGGKTTRLIEEALTCEKNARRYLMVKSNMDRRRINPESGLLSSHGEDDWEDAEAVVRTHDGREAPCLAVDDLGDITPDLYPLLDMLLVDEMHFLSHEAEDHITALLEDGVNVMVACLRTDYRAQPFPPSTWLMHHGTVINCDPDCAECDAVAEGIYTHRVLTDVKDTIVCGGLDDYHALCRACYKAACPEFYDAITP